MRQRDASAELCGCDGGGRRGLRADAVPREMEAACASAAPCARSGSARRGSSGRSRRSSRASARARRRDRRRADAAPRRRRGPSPSRRGCARSAGCPASACARARDLAPERPQVRAEVVVDEAAGGRFTRQHRQAALGQRERAVGADATRQQVRPVFRAVQVAHALVVRVEDDAVAREDAVRGERQERRRPRPRCPASRRS